MNNIIESNGGNNYTIMHINKEHLEREGQLPRSICVTRAYQWEDTLYDNNSDNGNKNGDG